MATFDVIVPCYGYGHFLTECVNSVLFQSERDVRVLIIDDASPDNTAEVAQCLAQRDGRVSIIRHAVNKGHIPTFNEGLAWARADYMLLLSADDLLLPGALSRAARVFEKWPEVGLTFGRCIESDGSIPAGIAEDQTAEVRVMRGLEFIEKCAARNPVPTATAIVRTSLQSRLGGYRTDLPHTGDMEMWLRFAAHSSVAFIKAYQAVYRRHNTNMSLAYTAASLLPDLEHRKRALDRFFESWSASLDDPKGLRRRMMWSLGHRAIEFASTAFNDGALELSEKLSDFAESVSPDIKSSGPWMKLAAKRFLGRRTWAALQPFAAKVRPSRRPESFT